MNIYIYIQNKGPNVTYCKLRPYKSNDIPLTTALKLKSMQYSDILVLVFLNISMT